MTSVSINLNPSSLGANFALLDPPLFSIDNDLDEPLETIGEEDEADDDDDDIATAEAVRTEATRAHKPFMFSFWFFY